MFKYIRFSLFTFHFTLCLLAACSPFVPDTPADNEILDGPISGLSAQDHRRHLAGDVAFNDVVFTKETGLGPVFVASSCGSCHAGDGRGHPSTALVRFGQSEPGYNEWMGRGGPQLQQHAVVGYTPEVLPPNAPSSKFLAPAVTGLGFLEAVDNSTITSMIDVNDRDGDGISGVANWVTPPKWMLDQSQLPPDMRTQYLARFGRKAGAINLLHQTSNAYNQDMGITSVFEPMDTYSYHELDPEVTTQTVHDVVFYLQTLRAPERRNADDATVKNGEQIFNNIGCVSCHRSELQTGYSPLPYLANKTIHPYSDLLLHDMGPELDDGYTEGMAQSSEWRTTPLWGLGLSANSQGKQLFLLHDGRARSINEAIEFHGGEAATSRTKYRALSDADKQALIIFLESL